MRNSYAIRVDRALNNSYASSVTVCAQITVHHTVIYPAATIFNIIPAQFEKSFLRMIQLTWLT